LKKIFLCTENNKASISSFLSNLSFHPLFETSNLHSILSRPFDFIVFDLDFISIDYISSLKRLILPTTPVFIINVRDSILPSSPFFSTAFSFSSNPFLSDILLIEKLLQTSDIFSSFSSDKIIIVKTDIHGNIIYCNDTFSSLVELPTSKLIGSNTCILNKGLNDDHIHSSLWHSISNGLPWSGKFINASFFDNIFYVDSNIFPIFNSNHDIIEYLSICYVISDFIPPEKKIFDQLKLNSNSFIFSISISNFTHFKHNFSSDTFDSLFDIFKFSLSDIDDSFKIFTLSNDTIIVVAPFDSSLDYIQAFNDIKNIPLHLNGIDFFFDIKILFDSGSNIAFDNILVGLSSISSSSIFFDSVSGLSKIEDDKILHSSSTLSNLKNSIDNDEVTLFFQPIVDSSSFDIIKVEALVRLVSKSGSITSPFFFLDISKGTQLYPLLSKRIFSLVFDSLSSFDFDISFNLSFLDIQNPDISSFLLDLCSSHSSLTHRLTVEILEDSSSPDIDSISSFISKLKSFGIKVAIDDFGSGFSNFERINQLKPDIIKIDGSLIKNISSNSFNFDIVDSLVSFSKKQSIITIAEFVENKDIVDTLQSIDVDLFQGYFFSPPLPLDDLLLLDHF
jgi:EAL domain-containing protein (putative c-di-GMP-specific phosphodiesterase class I)